MHIRTDLYAEEVFTSFSCTSDVVSTIKYPTNSLQKHGTWTLVNPPTDRKIITGRWVLKTKLNGDGSVARYKARYVARGYAQVEGVDFFETYVPVVRAETVRLLLSLAAAKNWDMRQFDVKTAFLYGPLEEEVYLEQPEGFNDGTGRVCKLQKGLYGLKQSPRQWNGVFHKFLLAYGFRRSPDDRCLYKYKNKEHRMYLCLYVDDGLVFGSSEHIVNPFLKSLQKEFDVMTDYPHTYVGLNIKRDRERRTISVNQASYITRVLDRFGMTWSKTATTPADPTHRLSRNMPEEDGEKRFPYREALGCLNYIAVMSRPDIAFAVNSVAKFCEDPQPAHWNAVKRILRYLKATADVGPCYGGSSDDQPVAFSDSDYAGDPDTHRSTTGALVQMNGGPVIWSSSTQVVAAMASTEAEYMAMAVVLKDVLWLRRILRFISDQKKARTCRVYVDNQGAIALSRNPDFHRKSKHIHEVSSSPRRARGREDLHHLHRNF
jgi:hypothetical protein